MAENPTDSKNKESMNNSDGAEGERHPDSGALTPELVREVTEKVYALLMNDLRMARERRGPSSSHTRHRPGGR
jgi:hypothetical protein